MKILALIGAAALAAAAPPASAQIRAQVVPAKFSAVLQPGKPVSRDVSVTNLSGEPAVVRVHLSDFTISDQGQLELVPCGSTNESIDSLVQFEPREFSLQPGESGRIHVTARIAPDGPATRWGVLLSEVRPAVPRPAGLGPRATAELGTTIYLSRAGSTEGRPVITGMDIVPAGRDSVTVSLRLRNMGERHFYVGGEAGITDGHGTAVATGALPMGVVLPGRVRRVAWTCPAALATGVYRASMSLDTGEPELLVGEASFRWPLPGTVETVISR
jgi:hypothetical protein